MKIIERLYKFAESYRFSAYIMTTGIVFYVLLTIWATKTPNSWVINIASLWAFKSLYILFFINLTLCSIKRFGVAKAAWNMPGPTRERIRPMAGLIFHAAFLLIPAGWLTSRGAVFKGEFVLAEGQPFGGTSVEYVMRMPQDMPLAKYPGFSMELKDIRAKFWSDGFLFEELKALCSVSDSGSTYDSMLELNGPFRGDNKLITLTGYGWSPAYRFQSGENLVESIVNLKVFPSGTADSFSIPDSPYTVSIRIWSDHTVVDGKHESKSFELKNPKVEVRVIRGKYEVYSGLMSLGQTAQFEGASLTFPEIREQGQFRVVQDRGRPLLWVGYLLIIAGLALRFI